jgi:hypothetical protein
MAGCGSKKYAKGGMVSGKCGGSVMKAKGGMVSKVKPKGDGCCGGKGVKSCKVC